MSEKKFCPQCGAELNEKAKFCRNCGAPVPQGDTWQTEAAGQPQPAEQPEPAKGSGDNGGRKFNIWMILFIVAAAVAVVALIGFFIARNNYHSLLDSQDEVVETIVDEDIVYDEPEEDEEFIDEPEAAEIEETENTGAEEVVEEEIVEEETADMTNVKTATPEEFVSYIYETYFISNVDPERFWDDCVSEFSKELGYTDKDTYVDNVINNVNLNGLSYISYEANSAEDIGDGVYKVDGTLKYIINGSQSTDSDTVYVISEGDQYKVLKDGIYAAYGFTSELTSGDIGISEGEVYNHVDGNIEIACIVENHTSNDISLGWASGAQIEIELANGETRYTELASPIKIIAGSNTTLTLSFSDVQDDIHKITIHNIHTLNGNGLPTDTGGSGSDVTLTIE